MKTPIESTHLGKPTAYPRQYSPGLLVAVPRKENRIQYDISDTALPFVGWDVWHAWEAGFLTDSGLPVSGILKIIYACSSDCLVESKSLKLYLNSLNMEKLGPTAAEATTTFIEHIRNDLSRLLNTAVHVTFFREPGPGRTEFHDYVVLEEQSSFTEGEFTDYLENPELLQTSEPAALPSAATLRVSTHLLRSNCKITHQPDWGSAFISMRGRHLPTGGALLKYLTSFRNEYHFHEEVCEMIYKRLLDRFAPHSLMVTCIYTRRGGIDICPTRASDVLLLPQQLSSPYMLTPKLPRQ